MRETKREFRDRHNRCQTHWDNLVDWLWMAQEDVAGLRTLVAEKDAKIAELEKELLETSSLAYEMCKEVKRTLGLYNKAEKI